MEQKTGTAASAADGENGGGKMNRRSLIGILKNELFPWRTVLLFWFVALFLLVLNWFLLYRELRGDYLGLLSSSVLAPSHLRELKGQFDFVIFRAGLVALLYAVLISLLAVIFAHRASGPMYALKRVIREIRLGKRSRLKLRSGDYFQDVADEFNQLMDEMGRASTDS